MNVKSVVENKEKFEVELTIEVGKEEFEAGLDKGYRKSRNSISVPGFRKGKAPRKVIEGMYGAGVFYEDAVEELYPKAVADAVEEKDLDVVAPPMVEVLSLDKDGFSFKATVTVRPVVTLEQYKGLDLETLTNPVQTLAYDKSGKLTTKDETLTLIPYFAWAHRGNGNMKVWLPQDVKAAKPWAPATLASQAKVEFSSPVPAKSSITDGLVPADENDRSIPYIHWWPKKNTTEWITYTFPEAKEVKSSTVYWYDDQPWGGCKVPDSWKLYYQDASGNWQEVKGADAYPCKKGVACIVNFDPVKTKAVKLELKQPETHSCGLFEWSVK